MQNSLIVESSLNVKGNTVLERLRDSSPQEIPGAGISYYLIFMGLQSPLPRSVPTWPQFPRHLGVISPPLPPPSLPCEVCGRQVKSRSLGSDQAPQRLSHGRTPLSLAIRGQGVWTRLPSFSQLEVLPAESGKQGSEPSLDACTHMNTTLCPSLPTHYAEKQQDTETSQASFLYQSSPPSLDWAFSSEK